MTDMNGPTHTAAPRAARWMLYLPLLIGLALVVVYWFAWSWAAGVMLDEIDIFADDQRRAGYEIEYGDVETEGFPFFLRARLSQPVLARPVPAGGNEGGFGWSWSAEELFVDASPFNPDRLILSPGGGQNLVTGSGPDMSRDMTEWALEAQTFRISLASDRNGLDIRDLRARPVSGAASGDDGLRLVTIGALLANTLVTDDPDTGLAEDFGRLAVSGKDIVIEHMSGDRLALQELEASVSTTGVGALTDRQPGESAIAAWQRGNGELVIEGLYLIVSDGEQAIPTQLSANGRLHVDNQAYPAGTIELTMKDHLALLSVLSDREIISEREVEQTDQALRFLSDAMGEEIKAPLQLRGGKLRLGPVAIMDLDRVE